MTSGGRGDILSLIMPTDRIAIDLSSSDPAVTRMERHSFVNLINVIHAELQLVERMIDAPGALRSTIHLAEAASRAFKEVRVARRHLEELVRFAELVESDLDEALAEAGDKAHADDVLEARGILLDVLPDADLRVQEVVARHHLPRPLIEYRSAELSRRLESAGGSFSLETDEDPVALPAGVARALEAVLGAGERPARFAEAELRKDTAWQLTLRGRGPRQYFAPLADGLRPSELHALLAERAQPLRGIVMLVYIGFPDGAAEIATGPGEAITIRVAIPAPKTANPTT
jgi:hypothetical protein